MRSQGLPVNMIVFVALGLISLIVTAAFFITGMSGAGQQTKTVEDFQAECNALCGQMVTAAFNINTIEELNNIAIARKYQGSGCARQFGCCTVTLRSGKSVCAEGNCQSTPECSYILLNAGSYKVGDPVPYPPGGTFYYGVGEYFEGTFIVAVPICDTVYNKCEPERFLYRSDINCNSAVACATKPGFETAAIQISLNEDIILICRCTYV